MGAAGWWMVDMRPPSLFRHAMLSSKRLDNFAALVLSRWPALSSGEVRPEGAGIGIALGLGAFAASSLPSAGAALRCRRLSTCLPSSPLAHHRPARRARSTFVRSRNLHIFISTTVLFSHPPNPVHRIRVGIPASTSPLTAVVRLVASGPGPKPTTCVLDAYASAERWLAVSLSNTPASEFL
jgi:hypothetical protein